MIPTCWYQELLPCRDQGTADWWYHVIKTSQFTEFRIKLSPCRQSQFYTSDMGYSVPCKFLKPFFAKRLKKIQNKTKSTMKKAHNIKPVYFNPVSSWKTLHHLTKAQDRVWNGSSKQKELLTQHIKSLLPEKILARLPLRSWESSSSILIAHSRHVNQGGSRKVNEVTCISDQHRHHTQQLFSWPHPVLRSTAHGCALRLSPGCTSSQADNLAAQCELYLRTGILKRHNHTVNPVKYQDGSEPVAPLGLH